MGRLRGDRGQILPIMAWAVVLLIGFGALGAYLAGAVVLRADVVTAADAAALAAAHELRTQLIAHMRHDGFHTPPAVDVTRMLAAAEDYAARNDAAVTDFQARGMAVTVEVVAARSLPPLAEVESDAPRSRATAVVQVRFQGGPWAIVEAPVGVGGACPLDREEIIDAAERAQVPLEFALDDSVLVRNQACDGHDQHGVSVKGLQPEMRASILALEQRMWQRRQHTGSGSGRLQLSFAFRSPAYQEQLCVHVTGPCAPAGTSMHQFGVAVDVANIAEATAAVGGHWGSVRLCQPLPEVDAVHLVHISGREGTCPGEVGASFGGSHDPYRFEVYLSQ